MDQKTEEIKAEEPKPQSDHPADKLLGLDGKPKKVMKCRWVGYPIKKGNSGRVDLKRH